MLKSLRNHARFKVPSVNQVVGLCLQWVGVAGNDVKVEWFYWFAAVRAEAVKLVKNGDLSYLAEGCGVSLANVYFYELLSRVNVDHLSANWFCSVGV